MRNPVGVGRLSAAFAAAGHDGGMKAFAEVRRQGIDFLGAVDFDGFAGGIEGHDAVIASAEVVFEVGAHFRGDFVIDQLVKLGQKLGACHFSPTFFLRK